MIGYIEYLNVPVVLGLVIIGILLVIQTIDEVLEFKGKVVPEFIEIREHFVRKKQKRQTMQKMLIIIHDIKTMLSSVESHCNPNNIARRDPWMKWVNNRAGAYDEPIKVLKERLDKNNEITMSLYIENKRSSIISFISHCVCPDNLVTREQLKRILRIYTEHEEIIRENGLQNSEVDIVIRIIREAYENNLRDRLFVEDVCGYSGE